MSPELNWLMQAKEQYKGYPDERVRAETNFGRANNSINILREKILSVNNNPNILLVGIGDKGGSENPLICSYSPFVISAYLEAQGIDYKMTVVDLCDAVINDVKIRNNLYLSSEYLSSFKDASRDWKRYLDWTKQDERVLHEAEEGLVFGYTDPIFPPEFYLKQGIHTAKVPQSFKSKLQNGDVVLIEDDIAVADLGNKKHDFVECMNVLYHLPQEGQMLAIANIAKSLNKNGLILINDIGELAKNPLFIELGGWCNESMLKQVGLGIDEIRIHEKEIEEPRESYKVKFIWAILKKLSE